MFINKVHPDYWTVSVLDTFGEKEKFRKANPRATMQELGAKARELKAEQDRRVALVKAAGLWPVPQHLKTEKEAIALQDKIEKTCGFKPYRYTFTYL